MKAYEMAMCLFCYSAVQTITALKTSLDEILSQQLMKDC